MCCIARVLYFLYCSAVKYREINKITGLKGTAVNIQTMGGLLCAGGLSFGCFLACSLSACPQCLHDTSPRLSDPCFCPCTSSSSQPLAPSQLPPTVYGNINDNSGTGVCFTRNPANGTKELFGEFLVNAQVCLERVCASGWCHAWALLGFALAAQVSHDRLDSRAQS